jgi:phosphoribosylformimino-5-aminoimidazole carboxamide ribotide isomerase
MLIPCIDLQDGQAVQLVHGRKRELAIADVFGLLERLAKYSWLHVIDLDAAMRKGQNNSLVKELCIRASRTHGMKLRVGGGIRTSRRAEALLECHAEQVIIGSAAFRNGRPNAAFLRTLAAAVGKRHLLVALDTMKGQVVIHGWRKALATAPAEAMKEFEPYCAGFLCTDVGREGTMRGANLRWFRELRAATTAPIVAAGGISTNREIRALEKLGMDAAVGMALYKNRLS